MLYRHKFFGGVSHRIFWGFFLGEPIGLAKKWGFIPRKWGYE
jgi:hypothetical protein